MNIQQVDIDTLREFEPLSQLNDQQLILLQSNHQVKTFRKGQVIIESGSADNIEYFLLSGKLKLTAQDGRGMTIEAHSRTAKNAIAHLQPRQYRVKALEACQLLLVDWMILAQFIREAPKTQIETNTQLGEFATPKEVILDNFQQDLANNTLVLPSLPDFTLQVNELINQDDCSVKDVARLIHRDPALTVKLITAANSPLFRGVSSIKTCEDAIARLGFKTTQRLLRIYALRELFTSNHTVIKDKMRELWGHCEEVAAIAYVLAKNLKGLSPDQAMLAGLIHDVGSIPLLNYIESQNFLFETPESIDDVVRALKSEVGKALLTKWHWPEELVNVAANAENWQYQHDSNKPDYVDVVIVSQLHAAIGKPGYKHFPKLATVKPFERMGALALTPDKAFKIINDAHADIYQARQLMSA